MMKTIVALLLTLALNALSSSQVLAALTVMEPVDIGLATERNALVIGNAAYENVTPLQNTLNDARALGTALQKVGFRVFRAEDVGRRDMLEAIEKFLNAVTPGSEALIYYSGHGVELDGQNFLLPIDIQDLDPSRTYSLVSDAIGLSQLLAQLESRNARVNLVMLDACRNNPFTPAGTRSLGGTAGLSRVEPPSGTIVVYSAAIGETALDKLSEDDPNPNGVFTRSLIELIDTPGLEIRSMVQDLRVRVHDVALTEANHSQVPSYYDSMIGDFFFRPGPSPEVTTGSIPEPCDRVDAGAALDELLFADPASLVAACQDAVRKDPDEERYAVALEVAKEQAAAQMAAATADKLYAEAYLRLYPEGLYAAEVNAYLEALTPEPEVVPVEPKKKPAKVAAVEPEVETPANEPDDGLDRIALQAIARCEEFVADRHTPEAQRRSLPNFEDIDFRIIVPACRKAASVKPDELDYRFRLAIALASSGQKSQGNTMIRELAASGFAPAQYELGLAYLNGTGVSKDRDTAYSYFQSAARGGYVAAMGELGNPQAPVDPSAGLDWLTRAADGGHAASLYYLGTAVADGTYPHYRGSRSVKKDPETAFTLLYSAYQGGERRAILPLVFLYDSGNGVSRSIERATQMYLAYVSAFPFSELDMTGKDMSGALRGSIQRELRSLGFYEGVEDGLFSPAVRESLSRYNTARFKE